MHERDVQISSIDSDADEVGRLTRPVIVDKDVKGLVLTEVARHESLYRVGSAIGALRFDRSVHTSGGPVERTQIVTGVRQKLGSRREQPVIAGDQSVAGEKERGLVVVQPGRQRRCRSATSLHRGIVSQCTVVNTGRTEPPLVWKLPRRCDD